MGVLFGMEDIMSRDKTFPRRLFGVLDLPAEGLVVHGEGAGVVKELEGFLPAILSRRTI